MTSLIKALGVLAVAATLGLPAAAPVQAQSISFSVGRPNFPFIYLPNVTVRPRGNVSVRWESGWPNWRAGNRARCEARYRSYDPVTNTFLGYDGVRHFCRL